MSHEGNVTGSDGLSLRAGTMTDKVGHGGIIVGKSPEISHRSEMLQRMGIKSNTSQMTAEIMTTKYKIEPTMIEK